MGSFECFEAVRLRNLDTLARTETDPGQRELLNKLLKVARLNLDPTGEVGYIKVTYVSKGKSVGGRLYAKGPSLQYVSKRNRAIISVPAWDYDMVNAYPTLLRNLCDQKGIPCSSLKDYIGHRDLWLTTATKQDIIASIFGCQASTEDGRVQGLRAEIKDVTDQLTPLYPDLKKAVEKLKPGLKDGKYDRTLMSYILQGEEMRVMADVLDLMAKTFPELDIQAYIYDGFMVRQSDGVDPEYVLGKINSWVEKYKVEFCIKPFECPDDFEPAPEQELKAAESDVDALRALLFKCPDYVKMNGPTKMVYNESNGLWRTDSFGAFANLLMKVHPDNAYGQSASQMENVWKLVVTLPDECEFFMEARRLAKGKLLFRDGIFDKLTDTMRGFTHTILFAHAVPHDIPTSEPANTDAVDYFHFVQPYPEPGVAEWSRQQLTRAVFGLGGDTMTFEIGPGANGKSERARAFQTALGNKIAASLDGKHLTVDKYNNSAGASPQLMELKDARLVYINDPGKNTLIDISLLKKITGGDPIKARGLYKPLEEFTTLAKIHFNVNIKPKFSEWEASYMDRRVHCLTSETRFLVVDEDDPAQQIYKVNPAHVAEMVAATDALLWILINEPYRDVPVPASVERDTKEMVAGCDEFKTILDAHYEASTGGRVASNELMSLLSLSSRDLANRMTAWGYGKPKTMRIPGKVAAQNGYQGLRPKRPREEDGGEGLADSDEDGVEGGM